MAIEGRKEKFVSSQVATYINRSILINSLPKDSAATRVLSASSDEEVLSFYSNTYESVDVAHFLLTERKERLFGLINLIRDGEYFLDVGCANGAHMDELYKRGIYGVGLDISVPNILRGLEQRPHLKFIHGFAENIPFGDAHFDAAIIGDVLEHFRDAKLALAEILRVTKTGFAACFPNSSEKTIEHINPVTVSSFIELCAFFALKVAFFDKDGQILQEADESFLWCFARAQKTARTDMIVQSVMSEHKKHLEDKARVLDIDQWKWCETHQRHQTETDRFNLTSIAIKGNKILEVACGNGDLSVFLAKLGFRVTGIDISNTGIHQAKSHAEKENVVDRTRFLVMDATKLDFPDNTFDCVIFPEVMEHVTSSRQYISEAIRVLKPGGRIVVSVPDTLEVPWPGHIRLFTKETLATEIEQYADDIIWYEMSFKKWLLCAFTPNVKQGSEVVDDLPVVNILMPTYNRSHLIRRAIDSIVQQTYANWKLLVINDGGEDVSDIVRSFRDDRIHYHCFGHAGKAAALNRGLELIDVGCITYLDDDDIVFPNHLEVLVRAARLNNKAFTFSDTYLTIVDENSGNVLNQYIENTADVDYFSLKFSNQINHKQILHTKGLSDMVGLYDESLNILIDYDYIKRLALAEPPYHVKLITGNYFRYQRDGKITTISGLWDRNPKECGESLVNIFKKHPLDMCELYRGFHYQHGIAAERDGQIASLSQTVAEREGQITSLNQAVAERDGQITSLNQAVAEGEGRIASLSQAVAEREGQITSLSQAVAEGEGRIASLSQAVAEREGQIASLNEGVADRDMQIATLTRAKTNYDQQITGILNSISWKITKPLRRLRKIKGTILWILCDVVIDSLKHLSIYPFKQFHEYIVIRNEKLFDKEYYLKTNLDVAQYGINPAWHYIRVGAMEERNPNSSFNTSFYLKYYPDVARSKLNPLFHFIKYGKSEGCLPSEEAVRKNGLDHRNLEKQDLCIQQDWAKEIASPLDLVSGLKINELKTWGRNRGVGSRVLGPNVSILQSMQCKHGSGAIFSGQRVAVLAHWDPDGVVDPYVIHYLAHFKELGCRAILISDNAVKLTEDLIQVTDAVLYRTCPGYDFTSWKGTLEYFPSLIEAKELILTNDSIFAPVGSLSCMHSAMQEIRCDFWGAVGSRECTPHLQSYYLVFRGTALRHEAFSRFWGGVQPDGDRKRAIWYETLLSPWLALNGLQPAVYAPMPPINDHITNLAHDFWKQLIDIGVPFFKRELLKENARHAIVDDCMDVLADAGYPIHLIANYFNRIGVTPTVPVPPRALAPEGVWPPDVRVLEIPCSLDNVAQLLIEEKAKIGTVGVFLHIYFEDLTEELVQHAVFVPEPRCVYISTDTQSKKVYIRKILESHGLGESAEIRVLPNRGWDIAPFLVGFADKIREHPILLRLHSKRSLHIPGNIGTDWRQMLFNTLAGSRERVQGIIHAFAYKPELGMVCCPHVSFWRESVHFGGNYTRMEQLLSRFGVAIHPDLPIDFPMGSMFWCRSHVLEPWLEMKLRFENFEPTLPEIRDQTLAHSIERLFFFGCGITGYRWARLPLPR